MASSTIKNYAVKKMQTRAPWRNGNWTLEEDNHLLLTRVGNVVTLSGYIKSIVDCPIYDYLFWVPEGYRPLAGVSLVPLNNTSNEWFFIATTDYRCSPQNGIATAGTRYFYTTWLTNDN